MSKQAFGFPLLLSSLPPLDMLDRFGGWLLLLALGRGAGDSSVRSIALVVIGGQTLCLLITLLITPVAYSMFDDLETWWHGLRARKSTLRLVEPEIETSRHAVD